MYKEPWKNYFFPAKPILLEDRWGRVRKIGQETLSPQAQIKLEWLIFYHTVGEEDVTRTASHFGISRKTFHKWRTRFNERNLTSLEEHDRTPEHTRTWEVTRGEEERIVTLRKRYLKYGKKKLKILYKQDYHETITTWKIERVIRKHHLYPDPGAHAKQVKRVRRATATPIVRIRDVPKPTMFGHIWHIDAIILWWYGARRVIFTAIEDLTKIGYARVYGSNASAHAADFLKRLRYLVDGNIDLSHQDNGSEFKGAFEQACQEFRIQQVFSRVRTPTDNAALERFNWTVQDEWLSMSETGLDDILSANGDLTEWLVEYNTHRPHEALDYQTPFGYAEEHFFKVLPMWSARTIH
jgi:transposase InsO family protein